MTDEEELRRMQELVRAEQARARRIQQIERDQFGAIRKAQEKVKARKQARKARKRNRPA